MKLFRSNSKGVIGIDITTNAIKLVELAGSYANPRVVAWGEEPLPQGAFTENSITNTDILSDALNKLLRDASVKGSEVAVAVSSSHAITKVLTMPSDMRESELEEQISIEALHFIPYPIDEVNIDFEVLGRSLSNKNENDVLLVACRSSIIDDYIDLVENCNLTLNYIDIDTYALERVYRTQNNFSAEDGQPVALFDIGKSSSNLMVLDESRVLYSRQQSFGTSQLIKLVRKEYPLSSEEAKELLRSDQPPADFKAAVLEPYVEMLRQEINRALQFFYSSSNFSDIDSLVLSGSGASMKGLADELEVKMRTKVSMLNPVSNATVHSRREAISDAASGLSVAYGLSLRGLT